MPYCHFGNTLSTRITMENNSNLWRILLLQIFGSYNFIQCAILENFLADLASVRFPDCALFFLQQSRNLDEKIKLDLERVVTRVGIVAFYNVELEEFSPGDDSCSLINTSAAASGYNRNAPVCKFAIIHLNKFETTFLTRVKRLISPAYHPLVRPDSDPWVWITSNPADLKPLLLSEAFPTRIKYKLGISTTPPGELVIQSACFFCGDGGTPRIINLPHDKNPMDFEYYPDYVVNLNGKVVRISAPAVTDLVQIDGTLPSDAINNGKRGICVSLIEEFLMQRLNFTYNIFLSSGKDGGRGGGTGLQLPDGRWIGVIGDLVSGRAEMGFLTAKTPERLPHVTFTNGFFFLSYLTFTTTFGSRVFSPAALLWPFDLLMWGCIGASTLTAFLVFKFLTSSMHLLGLDSGDAMSFSRRGVVSKDDWGIKHQIFFTATTYLDQDCVMPRSTPLRCFVALWLFFTLIITTIYRSKMVSLLAFPVLDKVPTTFEELAYSGHHVIFLKHGDAAYSTLKASTDPVYVKLVNEMEVMTGSGIDCLLRVMDNTKTNGKKQSCIAYVFALDYLKARNLSDADARQLVEVSDTVFSVYIGLSLEPGSIYRESVERWLGWTRPFHLTQVWQERDIYLNVRKPKREWWGKTGQTEKLAQFHGVESDDLTLKHISGAFYALAACLMISTGIFVQELIYFYRVNGKKELMPPSSFVGSKSTGFNF